MNVIKFEDIKWMRRSMRGNAFGSGGKSKCYLPAGVNVIEFETEANGRTLEDVRLYFGTRTFMGFGAVIHADCFDVDGNDIDTERMFLSEDGKDPREFNEQWAKWGKPEPRQALKAPMKYTLVLESEDKIKLNYYSLG